MNKTLVLLLAIAASQTAIAVDTRGSNATAENGSVPSASSPSSNGPSGLASSSKKSSAVKASKSSKTKKLRPRKESAAPTLASQPASARAISSTYPTGVSSVRMTTAATTSVTSGGSSESIATAAVVNPSAVSSSSSALTPAIAANATASAMPARATTPTGTSDRSASDTDKSPAVTRRKLNIKARLDDGRYSGFHQGGGDQPAGDQQFRPAGRVQAENDRISRESRNKPAGDAATTGASTPEMRDQSAIIRTQ